MTYAEAIQFLYDLRWFGAEFGLKNTLTLAAQAGNPQNRLRFIHVAGTNGKGSTCAMLESIYRAAGLRVGLFTSPHLVSFRERIQVNRRWISEADVVRLVSEMRWTGVAPVSLQDDPAQKTIDGDRRDAGPTLFEFVTVMALRYFAEQQCELVIWETGLGGRLDATNIVTPLASVITNIQFDHQQWLGDTLTKIAAEKAGIIKPSVPVVTATGEAEALRVIEAVAREKDAKVVTVGQASRLSLTSFSRQNETGATPVLRLLGEHQQLNAALALATVDVLQEQLPVSGARIRAGLSDVDWPGRLQLVTRPGGQKILLDGAHNPAGVEALAAALQKHFPDVRPTLILGMLADKDWRPMCARLAALAARILTVPVGSERTAQAAELAAVCRETPSVTTLECSALAEALQKTASDSFVVIAGSLYLVGEALELLGLSGEAGADERTLNEWSGAKPRELPASPQ